MENLVLVNPLPPDGKRQEFLDVYEMSSETLSITESITEGDGADRVMQQFAIVKYEVLPDNATPSPVSRVTERGLDEAHTKTGRT